jgi:hypothetical protein
MLLSLGVFLECRNSLPVKSSKEGIKLAILLKTKNEWQKWVDQKN